MNAIEIIKNYKSLLDEGIINQSDFEAKKTNCWQMELTTLIKQVSKVYGDPKVEDDEGCLWDTGTMQMMAIQNSDGTIYLDFFNTSY
ncbi:MAG: SHOCT domain-containing protein [Mogibacterium sp.]|nr:SHOCT domain-containing protein [Mogibacterium sp.]